MSAWECDPVSAFGSILAFNRRVDAATARRIGAVFVEAVIAPGFEADAKKALAEKKSLRVMDMDTTGVHRVTGFDLHRVMGGLLAQEWDLHRLDKDRARFFPSRVACQRYVFSTTLSCMKTTVEIPDPLLKAARKAAAEEDTTVRALVEEGLRRVLEERQAASRFHLRDASFGEGGLHPDIREGSWERMRDLIYEGRGT